MDATIVNVMENGLGVQFPTEEAERTCPAQRAYLFGISLEGLNLTGIFKLGQCVTIITLHSQDEWQVHICPFNLSSQELLNELDAYCASYDVDLAVKNILIQRSGMFQSEINWSPPLECPPAPYFSQPQSSFSSPPVDPLSCSNELGTVVDVQVKFGTVQIHGINLRFKRKQVLFFAAPMHQMNLTTYLFPGLEVFVDAKEGKVNKICVGNHRKVTSLTMIEEMKHFCEHKGIAQQLISSMEKTMVELYNFQYGCHNDCRYMSNESGVIEMVNQLGGVIKGKNSPWTVAFKRRAAYIFGVSLRLVPDLTLFLQSGQEVFVHIKNGKCAAMWIGPQRNESTEDSSLEAFLEYCHSRKISDEQIKKLMPKKLKCTDMTKHQPWLYGNTNNTETITSTVVRLDKDSGEVMCRGKQLSFKRREFFLYGYSVNHVPLNRLYRGEMNVNVTLRNGILERVWIGSRERSRSDLKKWIQCNVSNRDTIKILDKHWHLSLCEKF